MAVTVNIPTALRRYLNERDEMRLELDGTVRQVFESLVRENGELQDVVFHSDGSLKNFLNVFVNEEDIRFEQGLETPVKAGDQIHIIASIAGG